MAFSGFTCPAPMAKTSAALSPSMIGFPWWSVVSAVVTRADFIAAGDHSGCAARLRTAGSVKLGPLDENCATAGALDFPTLVPANMILPLGFLVEFM
nr:hypothetical protein TSUD_336410 [Ipomoea trifida]